MDQAKRQQEQAHDHCQVDILISAMTLDDTSGVSTLIDQVRGFAQFEQFLIMRGG